MKEWKPDFSDCVRTEETVLHAGEKGGAVEDMVRGFLRQMLPHEYGIGKGFIAYHDPACLESKGVGYMYHSRNDQIRLTGQLDVIIYDALRGGPLLRLGEREVYPLESVFAYVEIKTSVDRKELRKCLVQSAFLRSLQAKFYRFPVAGTYTGDSLGAGRLLSVRSHVFALDSHGLPKDHLKCSQLIKRLKVRTGGFLSGMYLGGVGYFQSHHANTPDDREIGNVESLPGENALTVFKTALVRSLSRFPRIEKHWSAALDTYFQPAAPDSWILEKPSG